MNEHQKKWTSRRRQGASPSVLRSLLDKQEGRCALSNVELIFDSALGTPEKGGKGCHPLYPAVDHIDPGNPKGGHQIVCYALNDLKGHLPLDCFKALIETPAWLTLMEKWRQQSAKDRSDRDAFYRLLRPNAVKKNAKPNQASRPTVTPSQC
jgi:hypothetical protein